MVDAAALGELRLREAVLLTKIDDLQRDVVGLLEGLSLRRQREEGSLEALSRPRGRRPAEPLAVENAELQRRLTRTETELEKARRVIEV